MPEKVPAVAYTPASILLGGAPSNSAFGVKVQDGNRPAVLQQRSQHRIGHYPPVRLSPNLIGQKQVIVPLPSVTNDARIAAQDGGGPPVQSKLLELDLGMEVAAWIEGQREKATLPTFDLAQFSAALGELEQILGRSRYAGQASKSAAPASALYHQRQPSSSHRKRQASSSQLRKLYREPSGHASDTDYFQDGELLVPTVDASLDDSSHDTAESDKSTPTSGRFVFKREVVRLIHTLGIRHWRRLPLEQSDDVEIPRISGALTNAVYVVSLPKSKLHSSGSRDLQTDQAYSESTSAKSRGPPKVLLRIYGPNSSQLMDRESELAVLRRLARRRIGPRLLGIFTNGRFEEFLDARALTHTEMRQADVSCQIAKRMRELHVGIEVEDFERKDEACVWRNWDRWSWKCASLVDRLDQQVDGGGKTSFLCGTGWGAFKDAVGKYRQWLESHYGGRQTIRDSLVFAHNDTQYGNILRLNVPTETPSSPLLLPINEHKQLVVIDFEYAGANPAALEFANHFTEWCYDYHDSQGSPAVIRPERYPSPEEQERFLTAYITHLPLRSSESTVEASYSANTGAGAGVITTPQGFNGAESPFSLDATAQRITQRDGQILPVREQQQQGHQKRDPRGIGNEKVDASVGDRVRQMMHDSALWRPANSAQWVCWGIVQASGQDQSAEAGPASVTASVGAGPGDGGEGDGVGSGSGSGVGVGSGVGSGAGAVETVDSFDYLTYAHSRALFFWRDIVQLGVVKVADLPAALRSELRLG